MSEQEPDAITQLENLTAHLKAEIVELEGVIDQTIGSINAIVEEAPNGDVHKLSADDYQKWFDLDQLLKSLDLKLSEGNTKLTAAINRATNQLHGDRLN